MSKLTSEMESEERPTHPPDQIIKGKPKWTEVGVTSVSQGDGQETPFHIDRLNPSRHLVNEIESSWRESAEDTQRVVVNMMSDLNCELLVTLGDARLDPDTEKKYLELHEQWEKYKVSKTHDKLVYY